MVLVSDEGVDVTGVAGQVWYPIWDAGARLDHSVRTLPEMIAAADADLKVALGLLDVRHLAGDPNLTLRLRTTMLGHWRRHSRERLPELQAMVRARHELVGELAHLSVPDLKEAEGGLRDATVLKALVATWLVDVPHVELERSRLALLDVRDVLHEVAGRATDRINPEQWPDLAPRLGVPDAGAAQVQVRELGRRIAHLSHLTWRRVDAALARPAPYERARRPDLTPLGDGIALASGEVVLDRSARPAEHPELLLRAAALAAEHDVVLAPATAARLVREAAPLPVPWPAEARRLMVRLLAAGRGLVDVWETLEETGALPAILPEWERIRMLPHASAIHRFTVDRHVVETCVEAGALIREVARPDVLVVAALLHDIGKGGLTEHSVAGEPIAREIATRMGFAPEAVDLIARLVRWHLLLAETATTRDPDDPATVELITSRVQTGEALDLLLALTEADARATSPKAWSSWRAGLIRDLARRVGRVLASGSALPAIVTDDIDIPPEAQAGATSITVEETEDGSRVVVVARDRVGLLADVAAMLTLQRVPVRAARAWSQEQWAVSVWEVGATALDAAVLRQRLDVVVAGRDEATARIRRSAPVGRLDPAVAVRPEASAQATVLEVRTADRPGVVHLVCAALADLDITVRSAHVDTLGPQAVDVFYLQEAHAGALADTRAADAAHVVRDALAAGSPGEPG